MAKPKREQVTLRLLPESNEKLTRLADKAASPKGVIVENLVDKVKEDKEPILTKEGTDK